MAFEGGPLSTVGITQSYLTQLASQILSSGSQVALRQVWQGSGKSFAAKAGQQLTGALADSAVNIALNAITGEEVGNVGGILLNTGQEVLAPSLTKYLTGPLANQINDSIARTLESAGPFGPVLSSAAGGLVSTALGGIAGSITGAIFGGGEGITATEGAGVASGGNATNYKMFPGGGGEGEKPADYGGRSYTLNDVVFSLQPANQGPQAFGEAQAYNLPKSLTTVTSKEFTNVPLIVENKTANILKSSAMVGGLSKKVPSAAASTFNSGSLF